MAPRRRRLIPSLGPLVATWIERNLVHGPGDIQGQPVQLSDEQVRFLINAYALSDVGKRLVRRAALSRPKGWAKSEFAAMIGCAEALGPVRFRGWDGERPMGGPVRSPYIPITATEETQAGNVYAALLFMLKEGPVSVTPGLDPGLTRTFLPDGGKVMALTAKANSKDGGKETFAIFSETHLYNTPELHSLVATIRRNLTKRKAAEPWSLEESTMYAPGEGSVAETTHRFAEAISSGSVQDAGFLFDHRQGPSDFDFEDNEMLRAALQVAYGEAAEWMDLDRMVAEARDPDVLESDFRRFFLNTPTERAEGKWITDEAWRECFEAEHEIPAGAVLTVAVDAAHTRDTTACVWTWYDEDTGRHVQRSRVWSCVPHKPHDIYVPGGRLDNDLVRDFIRGELSDMYMPRLLVYDERYFSDQAAELSEDDDLVTVQLHQGSTDMAEAWDGYYGLVYTGKVPGVSHNGDPVLAAHVRNAVGRKNDRGWKVTKKTSEKPIDALAAAVMSAYGSTNFDDFVVSYEPWVSSW